MIKKILLALLLLIVAFCVVAALQPADFRITRTATIPAPPVTVFDYCNDLHKWQEWSPWAKLDPNCKLTFTGPAAGVGASFHWAGNNEVGEGTMTITESSATHLVRTKLEFLKPFAATNTVDFTLEPKGKETVMTWSMYGKNDFMGKVFSLAVNCDKMIGGDFERGFANLIALFTPKA